MRGKGCYPIARESSIAALIIAVMLACSISFTIIVHALPGDLIWTKTCSPSSGFDVAYGVAVDGTSLYIVGYDYKPGDFRWRVEKRSITDGSLAWKETSNPSNGSDRATGVAVKGTWVYIVGYDYKPGDFRWRVEKRSFSDGSLAWKETSNPSSIDDMAYGVAVYGTSVYIVGFDRKPVNYRWRVEKRSIKDGSLIWTETSDPSNNDDVARGVAVDGSGVYIVGDDEKLGSTDRRWRIEKRSLSDGSIIWKKTSNPSSDDDVAFGVAVYGSGVYIVGYDEKLGSTNRRWRVEKRSIKDGSLIWTETSDPSNNDDVARGVAVYGSGVYIVGWDEKLGSTDRMWRVEKRRLADGSLIWKETSNPSSTRDAAYGVAVDGTGVYIVGYDSKPGNYRWRMEKRYT